MILSELSSTSSPTTKESSILTEEDKANLTKDIFTSIQI